MKKIVASEIQTRNSLGDGVGKDIGDDFDLILYRG